MERRRRGKGEKGGGKEGEGRKGERGGEHEWEGALLLT